MVNRGTLAIFAAVLCVQSANAGEGWYATYEDARDAAQQNNVPLLLHFHASYCGPCRQMSAQVFSQRSVQEQLRRGMAAVEIDVQQRPDLAGKYGATTVPRDVVVFPDESTKTLNVGFKSTYAYLDLLRGAAAEGEKMASVAGVEDPVNSNPTELPAEKQKTLIGLDGFCPVRLIRDRKWVSGREDLAEVHRGVTYYFGTQKDREEFLSDPRRFSPQNLGCDPVVLYSDQQAVTGNIKFGAFFDNKLFLFESQDNRTEFKQNPLRFSAIRHAVKVDELSGRRLN